MCTLENALKLVEGAIMYRRIILRLQWRKIPQCKIYKCVCSMYKVYNMENVNNVTQNWCKENKGKNLSSPWALENAIYTIEFSFFEIWDEKHIKTKKIFQW